MTRAPLSLSAGAVALAGACALWLGFPNDLASLPPLVLLWPVALAWLGVNAPDRGAALRRGWLCHLAGGTAALYWLTLPVHNVGGLPWALAVPCALFIAACLALAGSLFALAAHELRRRPPWLWAVVLGLCWFVLEDVFARVLGFPWLSLSGALAPWPLLVQGADVLGAYGLAGVWVGAALLCAATSCRPPAQAAPPRGGRHAVLAGFALTALLLSYGALRLTATPLTADPSGPDSLDVLFVEGNVDQNQKWLPAMQRQTVELYLGLTYGALALRPEARPLVVWPETALPFFFENNPLLAPKVRELAARSQTPLLLGAPGMERRPGVREPDIYNRAFLLGPDGRTLAHYDKEHLVPFGEYLPSWLNWKFLEALLQGVGVYTEGTTTAPLHYRNLALGMLICYEGIFPWLAQDRAAQGANILVDISNDGWFGATPAARQHLYLTALRALEQNRWLLRGTNTGISAVVDPRGRLTLRGGQFRAQALWARAGLQTAPSPYHRLAPWLLPGGLLLLAGLWLWGPGRDARTARRRTPGAAA